MSLQFIAESFGPNEYAFQAEHALFCQGDPDPFAVYITPAIVTRFYGPDSEAYTASFLERFRTKPVMFIVDSWRLGQFPEPVQEMILGSFVPYRYAVWVPGRTVRPNTDQSRPFEVTVSGEYRWWQDAPVVEGTVLHLNGSELHPGQSLRLEPGLYELRLEGDAREGTLALDLEVPPDRDTVAPFYQGGALREFFGSRGPRGSP